MRAWAARAPRPGSARARTGALGDAEGSEGCRVENAGDPGGAHPRPEDEKLPDDTRAGIHVVPLASCADLSTNQRPVHRGTSQPDQGPDDWWCPVISDPRGGNS